MEKNNDVNQYNFWENRYEKEEIGWDLGAETPVFTALSDTLDPGKVCILGCGNGYDAILFSKKGFSVTAVDFAETPIHNLETNARSLSLSIETIKKDLESGNALSKCFEKHPKIFDIVVVNLIKAGEASGKLDVFLNKIVTNLEKKEKIKSQIKSAFFYPGVLLTVAVSVTVFMLMNVVPTFVNMYEGMGMGDDLPTPTAVIMSMSEFLRSSGGLILFLSIIIFVVVFRYLIAKSYGIRKSWHAFVLKMPIFGNLLSKSILAKVSMVLGNLNQAGVD